MVTKLSPFDPRAAVLGKLTSCCQSLGSQGEAPTVYGIANPNGGFYVLCHQQESVASDSDPIVSQCFAWRGISGNLVFDSIESQVNFRANNINLIQNFFLYLAHTLINQNNIPFVLVGTGKFIKTNFTKYIFNIN